MQKGAACRYRQKIKADLKKSSEYKAKERQRSKHYNEFYSKSSSKKMSTQKYQEKNRNCAKQILVANFNQKTKILNYRSNANKLIYKAVYKVRMKIFRKKS